MISRSRPSTRSTLRHCPSRPLRAFFSVLRSPMSSQKTVCNTAGDHAALSISPDTKRNCCRRRGAQVTPSSIIHTDHQTSEGSVRVVSCVTDPVSTGRATQPRHPITGPATQPETGRLTQLSGVGESRILAIPREFSVIALLTTNCRYKQTFTTKRRSESPLV